MLESNRSYSCDKIDFIIIEYLDIYGEEHREYFEGTSLSTPDAYENIQKLSKEAFKENYYRRETIMLKGVLEDLDE
jgi:hypothetical protein